jgi:hypothetical protein
MKGAMRPATGDPMDLNSVPYLLLARELEFPWGNERVFICLCLLDHLIVGTGLGRDEAMNAMACEIEKKYGPSWDFARGVSADDDDHDFDELNLN